MVCDMCVLCVLCVVWCMGNDVLCIVLWVLYVVRGMCAVYMLGCVVCGACE